MAYNTLRCAPALFEKDLAGKNYIVTGANSGIGLETARQLVKQGAHVVMACRSVEAAHAAAKKFADYRGTTDAMWLNLADLSSVRDFVRQFKAKYQRLDALVNNAGVASFSLQRTRDNFELMFGVNHLGHFLLTELLLDVLESSAPARIVIVSSVAIVGASDLLSAVPFDDVNCETRPFKGMNAYGDSKLANLYYAKELASRLQGKGITVVAVHPGWARSRLAGRGFFSFLQNVVLRPFSPMLTIMSNRDGAQSSLHCLLDDEVPNRSGAFYSQCSVLYRNKAHRPGGWPMESPDRRADDPALTAHLVDLSRQLVKL